MASASSSKFFIYAALAGNLLIAVTKLAAATWTGSSAMLSLRINCEGSFAGPNEREMIPLRLHALSVGFLVLGCACAIVIVIDEWSHPQHMWIMNIVWPLTALFGTGLWLWGYFRFGRLATKQAMMPAGRRGHEGPAREKPFPAVVAEAASRCGSGCTLGDICAEWLTFGLPALRMTRLAFPVYRKDLYGFGFLTTLWPARHRNLFSILHDCADA